MQSALKRADPGAVTNKVNPFVSTLGSGATGYTGSMAALRAFPALLSSNQVETLRALVSAPYSPSSPFSPLEFNGVKNVAADILLQQPNFPADLLADLALQHADPAQDEVWRDYCLQMLTSGYLNLAGRGEGDLDAPAARELALGTLMTAATAGGGTWPGTALLGYNGVQCIADLDASGNLLRSYTWGQGIDNLLAMTVYGASETNTFYAIKDHLGSVQALVDSSGYIVESFTYDAWGNILLHSRTLELTNFSCRYLFQGREYSAVTSLYNFRARWYDSATGRWLSNDPIGLSGGLNLYAFCVDNPLNFRDPDGFAPDVVSVTLVNGHLIAGLSSDIPNTYKTWRTDQPYTSFECEWPSHIDWQVFWKTLGDYPGSTTFLTIGVASFFANLKPFKYLLKLGPNQSIFTSLDTKLKLKGIPIGNPEGGFLSDPRGSFQNRKAVGTLGSAAAVGMAFWGGYEYGAVIRSLATTVTPDDYCPVK